ncbi:MAG: D-alanine--poly(phosphoribitol) ligase subunit DltA [Chloroflexota bacterium]
MDVSLTERIAHWGRVAPDRAAHESSGRVITYGELAGRAESLAAYLRDVIPNDGSAVAIIGHKEPEMLIGFLGCAMAGHPYIPIDRSTPAQRVDRVLETAGRPLRLSPEDIDQRTTSVKRAQCQVSGPDDPYYVLFTSGSTGEPKGVVITHGCLSTFINWVLSEHSWEMGAERVLNQAPFSFDLSVMDLSIALATGSTLVSITSEQIANPKLLFETLTSADLTAWVSTPSFAQMCLAERSFNSIMLPRLRRFLFCGETLPPEVVWELLRRFPGAEVWNTYGPTEATVAVTSIQVTPEILAEHPVLPMGRVMPAARVVILDEHGSEVTYGDQGEIVIAGPNVSVGYVQRPDLTQRSFFELNGQRAYRTGDLGRFQNELLFFDGRSDSQIKLHGYRIETGDIEENLRRLENVRDAVVIPVKREGRVESLAAFIVSTAPPEESDFRAGRALRTALAARLPTYMVPRAIRFLDSFPMTPNGKADRRQLLDLLQ